MRAVILAGGRGRRLEPYTSVLPKPLAPVGDRPILEIVIRQLRKAGFRRITLALGHLGELIQAFFASRKHLLDGIELDFVTEAVPSGTAGPLRLVEGLDSTFLVMNGDILTTLDYAALITAHRDSGNALTIAARQQEVALDLGVLTLDQAGERVTGYDEKPVLHFPVSMGVNVYEPRALGYLPAEGYFDFPSLVLRLIAAGEPVGCYRSDCLWLDLGRPEDFPRAQEVIEVEPSRFGLDE